jgi:hypothetical protein
VFLKMTSPRSLVVFVRRAGVRRRHHHAPMAAAPAIPASIPIRVLVM